MKVINTTTALNRLKKFKHDFDSKTVGLKLHLLQTLEESQLQSSDQVLCLHELLCFMQAYPDNEAILIKVERMLGDFGNRSDLKTNSQQLVDTGLVGTAIHYRFYWQTARWLCERWPASISICWSEWDNQQDLRELLPLLLSFPAAEAFESLSLSPQSWIKALQRPEETDAAFLIRHFIRWSVDDSVREKFYDDLDIPLVLAPGMGTPSRTYGRRKPKNVFFRLAPWQQERPIARLSRIKPVSVQNVSKNEGAKLIDLARIQMIARGRDLYAFMHADPTDVRIISYDAGLQFICYGLPPERRSLLEAMYVFLILRNGVPIGYTQAVTLMRSAEVNFNVFDTFRGTETSRVFVYTLAMIRYLFSCNAFVINTQQLGEDNHEALKSGAFWFYYKHGFRPESPDVKQVVRKELALRKRNPQYRSSLVTLRKLAHENLYLLINKPRTNLVDNLPTDNIGLLAARIMESHASAAHPNGAQRCIRLATELLEYRPAKRLSQRRHIAWERWSPVVLALPGVSRWSPANKRNLIKIINAKGGRRESDYIILFDRLKPLHAALQRLGKMTSH